MQGKRYEGRQEEKRKEKIGEINAEKQAFAENKNKPDNKVAQNAQ